MFKFLKRGKFLKREDFAEYKELVDAQLALLSEFIAGVQRELKELEKRLDSFPAPAAE